VIQRRRGPRFLNEPIESKGVLDELGWKDFQRNGTAENSIPRSIHFAHSTAPEQRLYLIVAEYCIGEIRRGFGNQR
jgi:hypothetical protein